MKNSEFLFWVHARLQNAHGENPDADYMKKLHNIASEIVSQESIVQEITLLSATDGDRFRKLLQLTDSESRNGKFAVTLDYNGASNTAQILDGDGDTIKESSIDVDSADDQFRDAIDQIDLPPRELVDVATTENTPESEPDQQVNDSPAN
jgi:hypothetical protein